jgi:hypothetical protein
MYDISVKNVKKGRNIFFILLAIGLFFLAIMAGILAMNYLAQSNLDSTTTSTRVEVKSYIDEKGSMMYSPVYYYTVDNNDYICGSNSSSNINPGTANRTVYYDSKNPENCMTEYSKFNNWWLIVFMFIPILLIVVAMINIRNVNKKVAQIKKLNQTGKLIKNLPYYLENSGTIVNGVPIQCPVVEYTLPSGSTVTMRGDPRHDRRTFDKDGMVDLVIDEDNPENYFIDFEINRLSGNLPTDYYHRPDSPQEPN